jgi:polyisoprenoid-binding protein YceI
MKGRSWKFWLLTGVLVLAVGVVGGPFVYIHFIEKKAPAPLALSTASPSASATQSASTADLQTGVNGTWTVTSGSAVGYRVQEVLFGQSNTAAGRTSSVTGSITVNGKTVSAATFTVDMTSVTSDEQRRDNQFNGRIMDTSSYPTATFKLSSPIVLSSIPAVGVQASTQATGVLTMHGTSKTVTFTITGRRTAEGIQITGQIPITFADWNIPNPSFGPVSTEDHGILEFLLVFKRA